MKTQKSMPNQIRVKEIGELKRWVFKSVRKQVEFGCISQAQIGLAMPVLDQTTFLICPVLMSAVGTVKLDHLE